MGNEAQFNSACGKTGRLITARIFPNNDVLKTIGEICIKHNIQYGEISTSIGSLRRISFNYVSTTTPKPGTGHTTHIEKEGPFGLLSGQGVISPGDEPNKMNIHYHAVISREDGVAIGGHIEEGTITLSTLDLVILEITGVKMVRTKDPVNGIVFTSFEEI